MPRRTGGFIGHRGLQAPDPPTAVTPTAGAAQVSVAFTAPSDVGDDAITAFVATTNDGFGATGSSSPLTITSLTNGTNYTVRVFAINDYGTSAPSDASDSFTPVANTALFGGGVDAAGNAVNRIDSVDIDTTGNATDHGDLTVARYFLAALGSETRGVFAAGNDNGGSAQNIIDFVTFASTGNAQDFGDLGGSHRSSAATSSSTRGVIALGGATPTDTIEYITIGSAGNASDFGDLTLARSDLAAGASSAGRGFFAGGQNNSDPYYYNTIDYITIGSTGNATDFEDLSVSRTNCAGCASATRGLIGGGLLISGAKSDTIDYITIGSTGNATDFGNLSAGKRQPAAASSLTRGLFAGGLAGSTVDDIEYVTIGSTGNVTDFGNLIAVTRGMAGCSSAHGGLS